MLSTCANVQHLLWTSTVTDCAAVAVLRHAHSGQTKTLTLPGARVRVELRTHRGASTSVTSVLIRGCVLPGASPTLRVTVWSSVGDGSGKVGEQK